VLYAYFILFHSLVYEAGYFDKDGKKVPGKKRCLVYELLERIAYVFFCYWYKILFNYRNKDRKISRPAFQELQQYLKASEKNVDIFMRCKGLPVLEAVLGYKDEVCCGVFKNSMMNIWYLFFIITVIWFKWEEGYGRWGSWPCEWRRGWLFNFCVGDSQTE
jgi:hypothetical protein